MLAKCFTNVVQMSPRWQQNSVGRDDKIGRRLKNQVEGKQRSWHSPLPFRQWTCPWSQIQAAFGSQSQHNNPCQGDYSSDYEICSTELSLSQGDFGDGKHGTWHPKGAQTTSHPSLHVHQGSLLTLAISEFRCPTRILKLGDAPIEM